MAEVQTSFDRKTIRDVDAVGKTALVRVDFNVPIVDGQVADTSRMRATLPTIRYLMSQGARTVLCSHLGRPGGHRVPGLSLRPLAATLERMLGAPVAFCPDAIGPRARRAIDALPRSGVLLLENVRFYPEEERNAPEFARALAALADVFVNDAFGAAHRRHASTVGVATLIPAVAGLLMEQELHALARLRAPERPFAVVAGGAKIADKVGFLAALCERVDRLLIGGGMANTFLVALGYRCGRSLYEPQRVADAERLIAGCRERGVQLVLPIDAVVGDFFVRDADHRVVQVEAVPEEWMILDVGPLTADRFERALSGAKTVFWNGPLGVAEWPEFAHGSEAIARSLAKLKAFRVVGGGETAAVVSHLGLIDQVDHVSTGGGAAMEFIERGSLPGVDALAAR